MIFNRKVKRKIKELEMKNAIRIELISKGLMEIYFMTKFEKNGSTYLLIKSTQYEFNERNDNILKLFPHLPIIDKRGNDYVN